MNKVAVLEGLLFVVGDDGITLDKICDVLEINENEARNLLKELQNEYEKETRGIRISYLSNSFKLTTKKEHIDYYQKLIKDNYLKVVIALSYIDDKHIFNNKFLTQIEVY